jgi:hypothetical protein
MNTFRLSGKFDFYLSIAHDKGLCALVKRCNGYINKLCTRTLYDENGYPHVCLDEAMKRRLEIKLIHAIVTTK